MFYIIYFSEVFLNKCLFCRPENVKRTPVSLSYERVFLLEKCFKNGNISWFHKFYIDSDGI